MIIMDNPVVMAASQNEQASESITIFKVLLPSEWEDFQKTGAFKGSELDLKDGYIHTSFEFQVAEIIERFFKEQKQLIIVSIGTDKLPVNSLKIEFNKKRTEKFPHIYGDLSMSAVTSWKVFEPSGS